VTPNLGELPSVRALTGYPSNVYMVYTIEATRVSSNKYISAPAYQTWLAHSLEEDRYMSRCSFRPSNSLTSS
jgi:hypothetical protein